MNPVYHSKSILAPWLIMVLACFGAATISPTEAAEPENPLVSVSYGLEIEGKLAGSFAWVEGVGSESEVIQNMVTDAGTGNVRVEKNPGRLTWSGIALTRGISSNMDMWDWRKKVEDGDIDGAMSSISIIAYDQSGSEITRWNFENAWPNKISASMYSAEDSEMKGVETLTIVHFPSDGIDECPDDPLKTKAGACGCGIADTDSNDDGSEDCKALIMKSGFERSGIPAL